MSDGSHKSYFLLRDKMLYEGNNAELKTWE
jgi:hypothetical protein